MFQHYCPHSRYSIPTRASTGPGTGPCTGPGTGPCTGPGTGPCTGPGWGFIKMLGIQVLTGPGLQYRLH